MDYYEQHLLGLAVEAMPFPGCELTVRTGGDGVGAVAMVWDRWGRSHSRGVGGTLAESLSGLLDDLGVPVPVRPSEADTAEFWDEFGAALEDHRGGAFLRDYAVGGSLVLLAALLERGAEG